ncbi:Protein of unknown function, partial [Gryllus bimaculatus]
NPLPSRRLHRSATLVGGVPQGCRCTSSWWCVVCASGCAQRTAWRRGTHPTAPAHAPATPGWWSWRRRRGGAGAASGVGARELPEKVPPSDDDFLEPRAAACVLTQKTDMVPAVIAEGPLWFGPFKGLAVENVYSV